MNIDSCANVGGDDEGGAPTVRHLAVRAGGVVALAHEPALQLTASACEDGTVQLWSARWEELGSVAPPRPDLTPTALAVLVRYRFPHGRCCAF